MGVIKTCGVDYHMEHHHQNTVWKSLTRQERAIHLAKPTQSEKYAYFKTFLF